MNEQKDDIQQRLLLAFALTFLILMGWPSLMQQLGLAPKPQNVQNPQSTPLQAQTTQFQSTPQTSQNNQELVKSTPQIYEKQTVFREYTSKSTSFGISAPTAAIVRLAIRQPQYPVSPGELNLLSPEEGLGLLTVAWNENSTPWMEWSPQPAASEVIASFKGQAPGGVEAGLQYDFSKDAQNNAVNVTFTLTNPTNASQTVQPRILAGRSLNDPHEHGRYRLLRSNVAGKIHNLKASAPAARFAGDVQWVTAQTKYYTAIFEPQEKPQALRVTDDGRRLPQAWAEYAPMALAPGEMRQLHMRFYAGPLDYRYLDALKMDTAVSLGALTTVTRLLEAGMNGLHRWTGNYGFAIVLLTVLLSLLTYPLTWTSFRTMKKMELVQPEIKALQGKHKSDPKKLNEELMKVYKKHQVNPLGGCLPLLLQMPILMGLYQVLTRSPELRGARFLMIRDLAAPDAILKFPAALPVVGSTVNVLPIAMAAMMFLQQKISSRGKALTEEQRIQQQVFVFMPLLFGFMFYTLPSGLVLYWLLSTTLVVIQQQFMLRRIA
ncbi:MAG: YidC/Oxa1 family insertase periplasmic-domain containing protein [Candidatus Omnitrophica bacterium]|nr:YidC/Oxa1 family insertase periplasmic-domain containing protein [Candidatus Omnitrophota bacterium]